MVRPNREELAAPSGPWSAAQRVRAAVASASGWVASARDWRWGAVLAKVLLAGLGLVLLGAIGRSALANGGLSPAAATAADAGSLAATPMALVPTAPPLNALASPPAGGPAIDAAATPSPPAAMTARGRATPDDPVYLNQASAADLHRLPGIGAKRAEAILALRTRLGHFRQIEDLLKVKGVGRASLKKLRPLVRLDPPPTRGPDAGTGDAAQP